MSTDTAWTPRNTFPERLALVRNHHGWNMKEAANACGISPATWRTWEAGASPHNYVGICQQIAERAEVDFMWLLSGASMANQPIDGYDDWALSDHPFFTPAAA